MVKPRKYRLGVSASPTREACPKCGGRETGVLTRLNRVEERKSNGLDECSQYRYCSQCNHTWAHRSGTIEAIMSQPCKQSYQQLSLQL